MREQLSTMLKTAMKAGDKRRVATVRLIQSALKDKDIELRPSGKTVTDEDIAAVLRKMVKQRQDSIGIYDGAGRTDLADAEREELAIIGEFLPAELDEAAIRAAIPCMNPASSMPMSGRNSSSDTKMARILGA